MARKLVSFDWAIKRILRSKANFEVLEGFLSELLFDEIHILAVLETESNQDQSTDKYNRLDIKVKNSLQEIILIEIQYSSELDYLQRILYATSKAVTEHLTSGAPYSHISKVISINILYFDFGEGGDYLYKGETQFIGMNDHIPLRLNAQQAELYQSDQVEKLYPEYYLIKIKNFNDHAKTRLDEWIYFLKNEEIKTQFKAKGLRKAKETLDYLKMNEAERSAYQRYEDHLHHRASLHESTFVIGKIEGIQEGIQEGIEQGIKQGIEYERKQSEKHLAAAARKNQQRLEHEQSKNQQQLLTIVSHLSHQGLEIKTIAEMLNVSQEKVAEMIATAE